MAEPIQLANEIIDLLIEKYGEDADYQEYSDRDQEIFLEAFRTIFGEDELR